MRRLVSVLALSATLSLSKMPAQAFDAGDVTAMRAAFADGLAGKPVDLDALNALIEAAVEDRGTVPLGFYKGTLEPMSAPITLKIPKERSFVCTSKVDTDPPLPATGTLQDSEERMQIIDLGDGRRRVIVETVDAEATVGFKLVSDGKATEMEEFLVIENGLTQRFEMQENGSLKDAESGMVLDAGSPDVEAVTSMAGFVVAANPFWFVTDATVEVGDGYFEDELMKGLLDGMGAITGLANDDTVEFEPQFFRFLLTGTAEVNGRPHLVFQGAMRVMIQSESLGGDLPISADFEQMFDAETALQTEYTSRMTLMLGSKPFKVTQSQTCVER